MSQIQKLLEYDGLMAVIIGIFVILFAVKEVIEVIGYFKKKLGIKTKEDLENEKIESRLSTLESHDNWQYNEIISISNAIDELKNMIKENEEERRIETIATNRSRLLELYKKAMEKQSVTQVELETFDAIAEIYIAAGGNHTMKDKIIPEFRRLPIKD